MVGGAVGAGIGGFLYLRVRNLSAFSVERQHFRYRFTKADCSECRCEKEIRFRCNYRDQRSFTHRSIFADGKIGDFHWEGDGVLGPTESKAGEWIVPIHREPSWPTDRTQAGTLSYSVTDTFDGSTEWVAYVCDREADFAEITIYFHEARTFKKAWATDRRAGQDIHRDRSVLDQSSHELHRAIDNPRIGVEYYIYWEWGPHPTGNAARHRHLR
jgi:hypothetical protein